MSPELRHLKKLLSFFKRPVTLEAPPRVLLPKGFLSPRLQTEALSEKTRWRIPHLAKARVRPQKTTALAVNIKVAALATLVLFLYAVFFSLIFIVKKLEVRNNHLVSREKILEAAFPEGWRARRYLLLPEKLLKRRLLKRLLQIEDIALGRNLFQASLIIKVTERATAIIWQTNNEKFLINREGVVYDYAPLASPLPEVVDLKNVPIDLGQRVVTAEFVDFITGLVSNFAAKAATSIKRITVPETTFEVEVETEKGFRVILDTTRSPEAQLDNLVKVLQVVGDAPLQYVDLRIADRIYYKLR